MLQNKLGCLSLQTFFASKIATLQDDCIVPLLSRKIELPGTNTLAYLGEASMTIKKFYDIVACVQSYKTFYARNLRMLTLR